MTAFFVAAVWGFTSAQVEDTVTGEICGCEGGGFSKGAANFHR